MISVFHKYRADVVFHLASYGMSGREMVSRVFVLVHSVLGHGIKSYIYIYSTILSFLQLKKRAIEEVNIQGTRNVIRGRKKAVAMVTCMSHMHVCSMLACMEEGVSRLVYTSTYNVVFGGQEIRNGDSTLPYLPANKHVDHYSRSKSIAEQQVRAASGKGQGDGMTLKTCALRCAGIYGKGEQRHFPRIVVRDVPLPHS